MGNLQNTVDYNKKVLSDVKSTMSNLLNSEDKKIVFETFNKGLTRDKFEECVNLYNSLEENIRSMIQHTVSMLDSVINSVNETDGGE